MQSYRASHTGLVGLVTMTAAAAIGLHGLSSVPELAIDWQDPLLWLERSDPGDALGAVLRCVGLAISYWVLLSTLAYYVLSLRRRYHPAWVSMVTLPPIRHLIDSALAAGLALSIVTAPVGPLRTAETGTADPPPAVYEPAPDGIPVPHIGASADADAAGDRAEIPADLTPVTSHVADPTSPTPPSASSDEQVVAPSPAPATPPPITSPLISPTPVATTQADSARTHTVARGDNLWRIASAHLRAVHGGQPSTSQIDVYWRAVVSANRETLRSGDPNLIYPGEIVALPDPDVSE